MSKFTAPPEYTIAAVSKLSGISCHTLRAWERRYGNPVPHRSTAGHRRYDDDDVRKLRAVAAQVLKGRPVGEVMAELNEGRLAGPRELPLEPVDEQPAVVREVTDRLIAGELTQADAIIERLASDWSPADFATRLIAPCMVDIGERWFRGECAVFQEHFATHVLMRKLTALLDRAQRSNRKCNRVVVLGAVEGQRHECGVLVVGLLLELAGVRAHMLGVDLPVRELCDAVQYWHPDAVGVSFVLSRSINKRFRELALIRDIPVYVGGRGVLNYQSLARSHGLHPLIGPTFDAVGRLVEEIGRANPPRADVARP